MIGRGKEVEGQGRTESKRTRETKGKERKKKERERGALGVEGKHGRDRNQVGWWKKAKEGVPENIKKSNKTRAASEGEERKEKRRGWRRVEKHGGKGNNKGLTKKGGREKRMWRRENSDKREEWITRKIWRERRKEKGKWFNKIRITKEERLRKVKRVWRRKAWGW